MTDDRGLTAPQLGPPPDEAARAARLARMRRRATGLLVVAAIVYLVARLLEARYPWLAIVRATAEASVVGGLADWFAVTALFRHPLGLPIPHTAIIPLQKDRIGRILGSFVQNHFLSQAVIGAELRRLRLSERAARWLAEPENRRTIARQVAAGLAQTVEALPEQQVKALARTAVVDQLKGVQAAPVLSNALSLVTVNRRHQELLNEALRLVGQAVDEHQGVLRERIKESLPRWTPGLVHDAILKKVMAAVNRQLIDVQADPLHPMRLKFDAALDSFIDRLRHSPELGAQAEALKAEVLAHPRVDDAVGAMWDVVRRAATKARDGDTPQVLDVALQAAAESLLASPERLAALDDALVGAVSAGMEQHRQEVADVIARTVSGWDPAVASRRLELAVGPDLQYIRINGTVVGGLAGLALYLLSVAIG